MVLDIKQRLLSKRHINLKTNCWEWTGCLYKHGYGKIFICRNGVQYVHRISASVFLNFDIKSKLCILHKCDNKKCFNPDHLFVGTRQDNMNDKVDKNRQSRMKGEKSGTAKLSDKDIKEIRNHYKNKNFNQQELAYIYNISGSQISKIINKVCWSNI